jgi:hypothetical protein
MHIHTCQKEKYVRAKFVEITKESLEWCYGAAPCTEDGNIHNPYENFKSPKALPGSEIISPHGSKVSR